MNIPNDRPDLFREELYDVPYLLYEVETLADGNKIVINKPGGKRNFGLKCYTERAVDKHPKIW